MHHAVCRRAAALVGAGLLMLVVAGFDAGRGNAVAQTPPPANDGDYFRAYAETLEEARQACTQSSLRVRLQLIEAQQKLAAAQQRLRDFEAERPGPLPPAASQPPPASPLAGTPAPQGTP